MNHDEVTASLHMAAEFHILQYAVGIFSGIVVAMATAIVYIYRDNRKERAEWRSEMQTMNEELQGLIKQNNEAFNESVLATRELRGAINSQEKAIERLENTILKTQRNVI